MTCTSMLLIPSARRYLKQWRCERAFIPQVCLKFASSTKLSYSLGRRTRYPEWQSIVVVRSQGSMLYAAHPRGISLSVCRRPTCTAGRQRRSSVRKPFQVKKDILHAPCDLHASHVLSTVHVKGTGGSALRNEDNRCVVTPKYFRRGSRTLRVML